MNTEISDPEVTEASSSGAEDKNVTTVPDAGPNIDPLVQNVLSETKSYAEYGVGPVTFWALQNTTAKVLAVHTVSRDLTRVPKGMDFGNRFTPVFVDLGDTRRGRPVGYSAVANFPAYVGAVWAQRSNPDTIYINGRFRICCFLTGLKNAAPGTKILFNNYSKLGIEPIIEKFARPIETSEQTALFEVPEKETLDMEALEKHIEMFKMVMD